MGLVAPSGAGKTLLLRQLVGLDPIQHGQVRFAGRPLTDWDLPTYRTQVMYLPQRAIAMEGTVADNLERAFSFAVHRPQRHDPTQILDWLQQLGRDPRFLSLQGEQLSGGEVQILALLRALQFQPTVLLLDEPTAALDPTTTAHVEALLTTWLRSPQRACILISHDPDQIHRFTNCQLTLPLPQGDLP
jgi:putative ABC transport system ATP-binding protein